MAESGTVLVPLVGLGIAYSLGASQCAGSMLGLLSMLYSETRKFSVADSGFCLRCYTVRLLLKMFEPKGVALVYRVNVS